MSEAETASAGLFALEPYTPGLISLYIPTHNRSALARRAVMSALAQTDGAIEVIVVSDGSSDDTDAVMAELGARDARLRYLRLPEPRGACAARNHALAHARGEWVTGLDDDDTIEPQHVQWLRAAYAPRYAFVGSSQLVVYPDRRVPFALDVGELDLAALLHYNRFSVHTLAERDRVLALGGFDERLPAFQDFDLWVRMVAAYGPALKTADTTYHVHIDHHMERISSSAERKLRALSLFVDKHGHRMTRAHLCSMELLALKQAGRPLPLATALRLLRRDNAKAVLSYLINTRAPFVQTLYHRLRAR